ncbi:putative protein kinase TKL-CTR1-DRK-2 family [Medicago truncatula]|uniref:Serine-threonine/tyrosine-protein kinase catalytic domain-containing protein n=1 Tax=Medicago truncatula TaxID=3880 RepID=A0A396JP33_MEDTR|nr:putative protein kinase TKL-CTR1-DRK-2 family [Medicago truncatula]
MSDQHIVDSFCRCDIFSYGVILWELFTKQEPWKEVHLYRVIYHVGEEDGRLDIPDNMAPDITNIIRQCLKNQV